MFKIVLVLALLVGGEPFDRPRVFGSMEKYPTMEACEAARASEDFAGRRERIAEALADMYRENYPYSKETIAVQARAICQENGDKI